MNNAATQPTAVENLRGGERTQYGEVAYTTHESDGVDVVFVGRPGEEAPSSHFNYGETLAVEVSNS